MQVKNHCDRFFNSKKASQSEIDAAVGLPLPCEEGWELVGHHCDKVFPEPMSYGLAQQNCAFHKGYLGSIHSENQNGFVKDMFTKLNSESRGFWIGLQVGFYDFLHNLYFCILREYPSRN